MKRKPRGAWLALLGALPLCIGARDSHAQDPTSPMAMTPDDMARMAQPSAAPSLDSHAPDPALERLAASEHVSPPMVPGMDMDDSVSRHLVEVENLEGAYGNGNGGAWDAQGWYGGDVDKLWMKTEGEHVGGRTDDAKVEALWAHAILPFWDTQVGGRHDLGAGPARDWLAFGAQGVAPYWVDTELTGYVGAQGRTAARLKTEYDLYLTERWVLKPEVELNAYGRADRARGLGAGLAEGQFGLRLRYQVARRCAPYAGYVYDRRFAGTAVLARAADQAALDHRVVAGVEFFF